MIPTEAVIVFCDDVKKLLDLGAVPKAILALEIMMETAEKQQKRENDEKRFKLKFIQSINPKEIADKLNEVIDIINKRGGNR